MPDFIRLSRGLYVSKKLISPENLPEDEKIPEDEVAELEDLCHHMESLLNLTKDNSNA